MYRIVAQVEKRVGKTSSSHQVPTFLIDEKFLGLSNREAVIRAAEDVINPTRDLSIVTHISICSEEDWINLD